MDLLHIDHLVSRKLLLLSLNVNKLVIRRGLHI